MTITWFGLSSFKIVTKDITIITDPFGNDTGLSPVRGGADIIISSNSKSSLYNNFSSIQGSPFVVTGPGEYDIKGVFVMGQKALGDKDEPITIYSIEVEDIRIAFLGPLKQSGLTDEQKELFNGTDIVLIPVGGQTVSTSNEAAKIATGLEPFIIIPHSYKTPGLELALDKVDKFLQELGGKASEEDKLTIRRKDLTGESTSVVVLAPQR